MTLSCDEIKELLVPKERVEEIKRKLREKDPPDWSTIGEKILIDPFIEENLGPACYDLSVGDEIFRSRELKVEKVDKEVDINPGESVLILSQEYVALPPNVIGIIQMKFRYVMSGAIASSGKVDPTWRGYIAVAITNQSNRNLKFNKGEAFCTLILDRLGKPTTKSITRREVPWVLPTFDIFYNPISSYSGYVKHARSIGLLEDSSSGFLWKLFIPALLFPSLMVTVLIIFKPIMELWIFSSVMLTIIVTIIFTNIKILKKYLVRKHDEFNK